MSLKLWALKATAGSEKQGLDYLTAPRENPAIPARVEAGVLRTIPDPVRRGLHQDGIRSSNS